MLTLIASKGRAVVLARQKDISLSTREMCTIVEVEADLRPYIFFVVNIVNVSGE